MVEHLSEEDSVWVHYSDIAPGRLIPANETVVLCGLYDEEKTNEMGLPTNSIVGAEKLRQILNDSGLEIEIVYESIYGESWTIEQGMNIPVKN